MEQQSYKVGAYCRISRDDDNIGESGSITIQKDIITRYCKENGLTLVSIYQDDGYSGLNFERPDFKRMIEDINKGIIDCVITKDLSRLGRDYIMTGYYSEVFFPERKVRYIAIGDGYDSAARNNSNNDFAPFKFILNDLYAKDLSKKQRASRNAKYLKGEFVAAYAPYGYRKDENDHNQLVPDEETAPVVQMIFEQYASGLSRADIRNILQENKVPTPLAIKHMRGEKHSDYMEIPEHRYEWSLHMIETITKNEFYIGNTVHLRYRKENHKSKMRKLPKKDWIVVENTHEPLISMKLWEGVKKHFRGQPPLNPTKENIFKGLVRCADCGKAMRFNQSRSSPTYTKKGKLKKNTLYMTCETYSTHGKIRCSSHYVSIEMLEEIVKQRLNPLIEMAHISESKVRKALEKAKSQSDDFTTSNLKKQLAKNEKRLSDIERIFGKLYEDRALETITEQNYTMLSTKLQAEQQTLAQEVEQAKECLALKEQDTESIANFVDIIKSMKRIEKMDAQILNTLIDHIDVSEKVKYENGEIFQNIDITYKFIGKIEL